MSSQTNEPEKPRLQLEFAGDGPGSRVRTAVGAADSDFHIDPSRLPPVPWWFRILKRWRKITYSETFSGLPVEFALSLLEKAEIPPLYRLGLGVKWGFIDPV